LHNNSNESNKRENEFFIYLEEDINLKLPRNFQKRVFLPPWKRDDLIRKIWWEKCLLPKKAKEDKCDVFISLYQSTTVIARRVTTKQSLNSKDNDVTTGLPRFARNDNKKVKHIMTVHDIIPKLFPEYLSNWRKKLYWKLTERAIRKADKIIAVSHRTEKDLVRFLEIDPAKITVSYPDVDEVYKKDVTEERNGKVLKKYNLGSGYIYSGGGLEVRKNTQGLIRAYKILLEENKRTQFVHNVPLLVISGKLMPQLAPLVTDVEKLIKELNLTPHIKLLDFVPQEDLPALYRNATFFIYPSFYEGFGLPVLEAMNIGTPVITSKKSSLPEVGGDSVLYCDPADFHDIAMVMKNVLTRKDLRETLHNRGKERAQNFSMEKFVEKVLNVI
jgi:glycosyltransferase involved in cell wall biosynthesis